MSPRSTTASQTAPFILIAISHWPREVGHLVAGVDWILAVIWELVVARIGAHVGGGIKAGVDKAKEIRAEALADFRGQSPDLAPTES